MRKVYLLAVIALAVMMGACGSESSSDESPTSASEATSPAAVAAGKVLEQARKPITSFPGPTDSPGKAPEDKKLAVVYIISSPFPENLTDSTEEAASAVGWSVRTYNAQGTPQGIESAMSSALASKPDALVLAAMPAAFMQAQLEEARASGIPAVALAPGMPEDMTAEQANLINVVQYDGHRLGRTLGDWVVNRWPDGAKALALTSPEFVDLSRVSKDFVSTITDAGPGFEVVKTIPSPVTDLGGGQTGVTRLAAPMRTYSDAKAMFINSENWFSTFLKAQQAANNKEIVALGADGDVSIPFIQDGAPLVIMGSDSTTYGWYAVDSLIRHFNEKPQPEYTVPLRLVDAENADEIESEGIRVDFDNAAKWKKLWGVG